MKILWLSPHGDGWAIAAKLRDSGNKVVYCCTDEASRNGEGYLPSVAPSEWQGFALRSDLMIVDGNFDSRPTRRSWEPSDYVRDIQQLRHRGVRVVGPTPTSELLMNDPRYLRKILKRLDLSASSTSLEDLTLTGVRVTVSRDPDGRCFLVVRHRHLLGDGNGPEFGNLGDVVLPVPPELKIVQDTIPKLQSFLERTGYNSYLNVDVIATENGLGIRRVVTSLAYPAVFAQIGHLLFSSGNDERSNVGLAVTVLNLDNDGRSIPNNLTDTPGFFGANILRDGENTITAGQDNPFVGAVVGLGSNWDTMKKEVDQQLDFFGRLGLSSRRDIGTRVGHELNLLRSWGYL